MKLIRSTGVNRENIFWILLLILNYKVVLTPVAVVFLLLVSTVMMKVVQFSLYFRSTLRTITMKTIVM